MVNALGRQMKRSRSLLAIHLSGNPGLDEENSAYLRKRIVSRPNEEIGRFNRIQNTIKQLNTNRRAAFVDGLYAKQNKIIEQKKEVFEPIGISDRFVL
jgi:hypothetical protein